MGIVVLGEASPSIVINSPKACAVIPVCRFYLIMKLYADVCVVCVPYSMLLPGRRSLAEFVGWYKTPKNSPAFFAAGLRRSIAAKGDGQQQSTISCRHQRTVGVRRPEDGLLSC